MVEQRDGEAAYNECAAGEFLVFFSCVFGAWKLPRNRQPQHLHPNREQPNHHCGSIHQHTTVNILLIPNLPSIHCQHRCRHHLVSSKHLSGSSSLHHRWAANTSSSLGPDLSIHLPCHWRRRCYRHCQVQELSSYINGRILLLVPSSSFCTSLNPI